MAATSSSLSFPLKGPAGEPVDFRRAALSHGLTAVAPFAVADEGQLLTTVVRLSDGKARTVALRANSRASCTATVRGPALNKDHRDTLTPTLKRVLALDSDLAPFYAAIADDPLLAWARDGAGRFVRSQTVFEDVIRTICTTNCSFSSTRRMIETSVAELGDTVEQIGTRAFPTPDRVAAAGPDFFREQARAGYRSEYIVSIARAVAAGEVDLDALRPNGSVQVDDDEAHARLLELPGVGPYAAAHAMMLMGRYSRPVLDSWSRPAFAEATGETADDRSIRRRFARFGPYAGLAFWLVVTRSWIR